ncbi:MAG: LysE family translocator [Candidatus Adiutrix sp.]|jgi:membrane protein implicated in regulation of membrane protease activity|nr:LysE family translocator [Candidatus Adiutrix sp.]
MPVLLIAGLVALMLGLILFFAWFGHILALIKATLPLAFLAGGAVAAYLGWEELRESRKPAMDFSSPDEASRYKAEARAYQAKINEIKVNQEVTTDVAPVAETADRPNEPEADNTKIA